MPSLDLKKLQQRFRRAVTSPGSRQSPAWLGIRDTPPIPYDRRLDIYQYAYFARIHESLQDDFGWVEKAMGKPKFEAMCRRFLEKYPSRFASLAEVGRRMPQFLKETAPWKSKPGLAELARFEWDCFICEMVANPRKDDPITTKGIFVLHPAVRLFSSRYEIDRVRANQAPKRRPELRHWLIYRDEDGDASYYRLPESQAAILEMIRDGESLEKLVAEFERRKISQKRASQWFQSWAQQQIISGVQRAGSDQ